MNFLKEAECNGYVPEKLSTYVKISMQTHSRFLIFMIEFFGWDSKILKCEYLNNQNRFWSETRYFFPGFKNAPRLKKQNSKNISDITLIFGKKVCTVNICIIVKKAVLKCCLPRLLYYGLMWRKGICKQDKRVSRNWITLPRTFFKWKMWRF